MHTNYSGFLQLQVFALKSKTNNFYIIYIKTKLLNLARHQSQLQNFSQKKNSNLFPISKKNNSIIKPSQGGGGGDAV